MMLPAACVERARYAGDSVAFLRGDSDVRGVLAVLFA